MQHRLARHLFIIFLLAASAFFVGYEAHKNRLFPIKPFIKRTLLELGVKWDAIDNIRNFEAHKNLPPIINLDIESLYYNFVGTVYDLPSDYGYGGLAVLEGKLIFVGGKGRSWFFEGGVFKIVGRQKISALDPPESSPAAHNADYEFTVRDVEIIDGHIYASAATFSADENCVFLSLFRAMIQPSESDLVSVGHWVEIFRTKPCLRRNADGENLLMNNAGGRIIKASKEHLLLSVGDFGQDGLRETQHSQDDKSHYGKILRVNIFSLNVETYTKGHRNPQGLLMSNNGIVYSTEHGPQGGDELNIITEGANYGWPRVTLGTDYGKSYWPLDGTAKDHAGYKKPIYAWLPSIGVSNLIEVRNKCLGNWWGDLLIASLVRTTLYRVKLTSGSPMLVEPIYIGSRIRDLINYRSGFALLTDDESRLVVMLPKQSESTASDAASHFE